MQDVILRCTGGYNLSIALEPDTINFKSISKVSLTTTLVFVLTINLKKNWTGFFGGQQKHSFGLMYMFEFTKK